MEPAPYRVVLRVGYSLRIVLRFTRISFNKLHLYTEMNGSRSLKPDLTMYITD